MMQKGSIGNHRYANPVYVPRPDLTEGACREPDGQEAADQTFHAASETRNMKRLCDRCPVIEACARYILAAEPTPGSWGGVWGGLGPADRKRVRAEAK